MVKVGRLQPFYLFLSRLGCSLGELQDVWPDKFCQAKHPEDQNPASIYGQDMEFLMTESHMHLQDIKSSPHLCREQQQKYVFHQVEFVDKNNLEAQNPRRDTSIPSVSAGLWSCGHPLGMSLTKYLTEQTRTNMSQPGRRQTYLNTTGWAMGLCRVGPCFTIT